MRIVKSQREITTLYEHDCNACTYLGPFFDGADKYDLYICNTQGSIIARYGDDGPDYTSMNGRLLSSVAVHTSLPALREAQVRAKLLGYLE